MPLIRSESRFSTGSPAGRWQRAAKPRGRQAMTREDKVGLQTPAGPCAIAPGSPGG